MEFSMFCLQFMCSPELTFGSSRSTGFILEGFPHLPNEVQYMLQQQLYPDIAVIMSVDVTEVQKRLLPAYLEKWRERRKHRKEQLSLLQELRREKRVSD